MKTISALTLSAALAAFVLFTQSLAVAASVIFGACFLSIFLADCTRTIKPLEVRAGVVTFPRPARRAPALELAA